MVNLLASDNFQRSNANPIGGNWTPESTNAGDGWCAIQIIFDKVYPSLANFTGTSFWNPITWPDNQWAEVVCGSINLGQFTAIGVQLRAGAANAETDYELFVFDVGGEQLTWIIGMSAGATFTTLASETITANIAIGDVIYGSAVGSLLTLSRNGTVLGQVSDSTYSSGSAGLAIQADLDVMDISASSWSGGGFTTPLSFLPTCLIRNWLFLYPSANYPISYLNESGSIINSISYAQLQTEYQSRLPLTDPNEIYNGDFLPIT